jgi:CheY-like chemotaxis protein
MRRLLIADDKVGGRELVRAVLEGSGYIIYEAADGLEALRLARELRPDLIVLDLNMPGLNGFEVIQELRGDAEFVDVPVLALTASAMHGDRERALAAGFTGYLSKPIGPRELRAEVNRLLSLPVTES